MGNSCSRRNRRKTEYIPSRRIEFVALSLAACLFFGGAAGLACALEEAHAAWTGADDIAQTATPAQPANTAQDQGGATQGALSRQEGEDDPTVGEDTEEPASVEPAQDGGAKEEPSEASTDDAAEDSSQLDAEPQQGADAQASPTVSSDSTQSGGSKTNAKKKEKKTTKKRYKLIKHTKYKRSPVYKTVKHTAAVRTVDENGKAVWTLCTACGQRHAKGWSERVVNGHKETFCKTCGGKHKKAYTEKIAL